MKVFKMFKRKNSKKKKQNGGECDGAVALDDLVSTVPTADSTDSTATLPMRASLVDSSKATRSSGQHSHSRCLTLAEDDFDDLIVRSRGWVYDPSMQTKPGHRARGSLAGSDYDKYIFSGKP